MEDAEAKLCNERLTGDKCETRLLPPDNNNQQPRVVQDVVKLKPKPKSNPYNGYLKLCLCGLSLMGVAYTAHISDPNRIIKDVMLSMRDGSYIFKMWRSPPIKIYIKLYIFNITNAKEFLAGDEDKLRLVEVGPYTYSESIENTNITWNENSTISFSPKRKVVFEPEYSVGDPFKDVITVTNIPLLGIASLIHNSSIGMSLALSTVVSYLNTQPLLDMTVDNFLWGYDDPLVKLARNVLPSWIDFERFGILDRMMDEGDIRITMTLKNTNTTSEFAIENYNGSPILKQWGFEANTNKTKSCKMVTGSIEGILFPKDLNPAQTFNIYRKAFCRPLPIVYNHTEITKYGFPAFIYTFPKNILDPMNPENKCYCEKTGHCLPKGLSDLSPCYYKIPVAVSLPHFVYSNESLGSSVIGMHPDPKLHDTSFAVQPDVGVPLYVKTRVQLNLVMKQTRLVPRIKRFNNKIVPIMWMEVELKKLPGSIIILLSLLLLYGPGLQVGFIVSLFVLGLGLVFAANMRYAWRSGLFRGQQTGLISYRKNNKNEERIIWRSGTYSQLAQRSICLSPEQIIR